MLFCFFFLLFLFCFCFVFWGVSITFFSFLCFVSFAFFAVDFRWRLFFVVVFLKRGECLFLSLFFHVEAVLAIVNNDSH